ncbi:2697_t:CDS:2, partial [Entrophospora sp. SA101]
MPENELIESLTVHSYDPDVYEKYRRKFTMTKLVDLIELNLKNTNDYLQAIKTFIGLPEIQEYLYNNVIFIPADFPGQLYICRAIIEHPVIDTLKNNLNIFDEYPVENFHSLLRRQTTAKVSTAKSLRRDALFIDHFHHENSLGAAFSPKQNYPYTIDELTSSYNQRLHMEEDINNELFSENNIQNTNPDFEDADHIISLPGIDNQLQKRILDDDLDLLMFTDNLAGQNNVMLYLQNEENVVEDTNDLKKIRTTTNEVEDLQIIGFTFRNQDLFIQLNEEKQCAKST